MKHLTRKEIIAGLEFRFLGSTYQIVKVRETRSTAIVSNPKTGYQGEIPVKNIVKRGALA